MESAKRENVGTGKGERQHLVFEQERTYTTREIAAAFGMGQRKVRAWLDYFSDYIRPDVNEKGHWVLDGSACERFQRIYLAMQEESASMNEVRKRFCAGTAESQALEGEKIVPIRQEVSYQVLQEALQLMKGLQAKVTLLENFQKELLEKYNESIRQQKLVTEESSVIHSEMKGLQRDLEEVHDKMIRNFREIHLSLQMNEIPRRDKKKKRGFLFG